MHARNGHLVQVGKGRGKRGGSKSVNRGVERVGLRVDWQNGMTVCSAPGKIMDNAKGGVSSD
eukprot:364514-Chlamydomonas_euryale.AAC.1